MLRVFDGLNGSKLSREYVEQGLEKGLTGIHVTVNNFSTIRPYPTLAEALAELAAIRAHLAGLHDVVRTVEVFGDFAQAERDGKLAVVLGFQNVPGVDRNLSLLELFHALGVRVVQIAHNYRGPYADGCAESADAGLSTLGKELVNVLNTLGILIDLSHTGEASSIEACRLSTSPVAMTHANAFEVCANARNKTDNALDALKENGGVIGVCYLPPMVDLSISKAGHEAVARHVEHIARRIGADHVALGSDFIAGQPAERYQEFMRRPDLYGSWPWQFPVADLDDQQRFLGTLVGLGLSQEEVSGIARSNFLRVFEAVMQQGE